MERTIRNLCVAMGIFICATVAALPLSSCMAVYDGPPKVEGDTTTCYGTQAPTSLEPFRCTRTIDINFNINPTVEITATSGITEAEPIVISPVTIGTGEFSATVKSNSGYSLYLSADTYDTAADNFDPLNPGTATSSGSTDMVHTGGSNTPIAALPEGAILKEGTATWAIKQEVGHSEYAGLQHKLVEYYHSDTIAVGTDENGDGKPDGEKIDFTVGIAGGPGLAQGYYTGTVVITAVANSSSASSS